MNDLFMINNWWNKDWRKMWFRSLWFLASFIKCICCVSFFINNLIIICVYGAC